MPEGQGQRHRLSARLDETYHVSTQAYRNVRTAAAVARLAVDRTFASIISFAMVITFRCAARMLATNGSLPRSIRLGDSREPSVARPTSGGCILRAHHRDALPELTRACWGSRATAVWNAGERARTRVGPC